MKKLVLLLAVVFSVSLFSCGNKAQEAPAEEAVAVEAVEAEVAPCCEADSCAADSCAADSCCQAAEVVEAVAE